jgi:hypothetical protein
MTTKNIGLTFALLLGACGGTYPKPSDQLVASEAALTSAQTVGATSEPKAQLYVNLAQEEIQRAKAQMAQGDNERAAYTLLRAKADADLAIELTRAASARQREEQVDRGKQ